MAKDEKTIYINAVADINEPSGYRFWMVANNNIVTELEFDKTKDKIKKSQYYTITFVLDSTNNAGLKFSKFQETVFWAMEIPNKTAPCVSNACHLTGIFVDPATPIQDNELKVINTDLKVQLFAFAFNFLRPGTVDGPTTNYALYDPIGSNQNGGISRTLANASLIGLSGLAAGAVLGTFVIAPALS